MKAKIKEKKEIAKDTLLVKLEVSEPIDFKSGQFITVDLINPPYTDEKGVRRHFSIVNSPNEKGILVFATRMRDSAFKKSLNELPIGNEVEIQDIHGHFILPEDLSRPLVFIAGGIGITPYISMLRFVKEEALEYKITLFYSNRNQASTAFLEELEGYAKENPNFKLVLTMTDDPAWPGEKRQINKELLEEYLGENLNQNNFFVVGPPPMVKAVYEELKNARVELANIKIENFTGY